MPRHGSKKVSLSINIAFQSQLVYQPLQLSLSYFTMKTITPIAAGIGILSSIASASVQGFDISHYQPTVNFQKAYSDGARFVIIKVHITSLFFVTF